MLSSKRELVAGRRNPEVDCYLSKPIRPSQLYNELMTLFNIDMVSLSPASEKASYAFDAAMAERLPLRILLAEDHPNNQKLACHVLGRMGYRVDVAANGLEALEALARQPYDVVLMDMQMPEMDGLDATREIRRRWPDPHGPEIVAMTANAMQGDRELCLAAGMDDYISKPLRLQALVQAIEGCAERRATAKEALTNAGATDEDTKLRGGQRNVNNDVFDPSALTNLEELVGGAEQMAEFIDEFLLSASVLLTELTESIEASDANRVRLKAHTLKSDASSYGAKALAGVCRELEKLAKDGDLKRAAAFLSRADEEFRKVKTVLEELRYG